MDIFSIIILNVSNRLAVILPCNNYQIGVTT